MTSNIAPASAPSASRRFNNVRRAYGEEVFQRIQAAKLLVVGAGGIGCELIKNLLLTGFQHVTLLDLDTIDVSNLNRQFLFRREHVGQSKAEVASKAVQRLSPLAQIRPKHDNIKAAEYDHDFFAGFDLVLNALDNLDARRHVNRLCLSAKVPLLESGTQGYAGQTSVIVGGKTECFECSPIPTPKSFAVCTIRHTPDKPVHCVVWSKAVYAALFGPPDEENIMADVKIELGDAVKEAQVKEQERKKIVDAAAANGKNSTSSSTRYTSSSFTSFACNVVRALFDTEISKQVEVKDRWKDRSPPTPLNLDTLLSQLPASAATAPLSSASYRSRDHEVLSTAENVLYLLYSIDATLLHRSLELGQLTFDKDDDLSMDIVACLSNLRMENFGIKPLLSRFALKGIAGNIVHAIATTNAIAAGLMVGEAIKVLSGKLDQCHTTWITRKGPALLAAQKLSEPNPNCFVCSEQELELTLDTNKWNLRRLFEEVLKKKLSMGEPSIDVFNRENAIGSLEDQEEDNPAYLALPLSDPGVRINHGAMLRTLDEHQSVAVQMRVVHREEWDEEENPEGFIVTGSVTNKPSAAGATEEKKDGGSTAAAAASAATPVARPVDDDDDELEMSDVPITDSRTSTKRKRDSEGESKEEPTKKAKPPTTPGSAKQAAANPSTGPDADVIELD